MCGYPMNSMCYIPKLAQLFFSLCHCENPAEKTGPLCNKFTEFLVPT